MNLCAASKPLSMWNVLFLAAVCSDDPCFGDATFHYEPARRTVYNMCLRSLVPPVVALATVRAHHAKNGHLL